MDSFKMIHLIDTQGSPQQCLFAGADADTDAIVRCLAGAV